MNSTSKNTWSAYEIIVQGELDQSWETIFEGMNVESEQIDEEFPPTTTLIGPVIDQAALRGLLCKLWDLNLTLISVRRFERDFV